MRIANLLARNHDIRLMLTGGIGYTYSLGSAPTFSNNSLPFTQIDLANYPFTPNASGWPEASVARTLACHPPAIVLSTVGHCEPMALFLPNGNSEVKPAVRRCGTS